MKAVTGNWAALERFLDTDPADVGCGQAMEILHVYVDLVEADRDAASRYPGVRPALRRVRIAPRTSMRVCHSGFPLFPRSRDTGPGL
jgi:hypothetical protein